MSATGAENADAIAEKFEEGDSGDYMSRKQCIFLQKERHGNGFSCAIYPSRPLICREFQCYRMVIYNRDRQPCGTVIGRNELKTADKDLEKLWAEKGSHIPTPAAPYPRVSGTVICARTLNPIYTDLT